MTCYTNDHDDDNIKTTTVSHLKNVQFQPKDMVVLYLIVNWYFEYPENLLTIWCKIDKLSLVYFPKIGMIFFSFQKFLQRRITILIFFWKTILLKLPEKHGAWQVFQNLPEQCKNYIGIKTFVQSVVYQNLWKWHWISH